METRILTIFTRTPLHVGAGSSVGAIDQPIVRERHTRFPVIPGTSLKGVLADLWELKDGKRDEDLEWLFGVRGEDHQGEEKPPLRAGALLIGEGRLLAFPVRSARGCFAWVTCPTALRRAVREGVLTGVPPDDIGDVADGHALCDERAAVVQGAQVMLEEYVLTCDKGLPGGLADAFDRLQLGDVVWSRASSRLVVVSDGMMGFFCASACEVAQHVKINDETGTASDGALFNQENVPAETLFYSVLHAQNGKGPFLGNAARTAAKALDALSDKLGAQSNLLQIGGDETTGLGWCTVAMWKGKRS